MKVLPGANVTSQAQADDPALGLVAKITTADQTKIQISVFAPKAVGNIKPVRVISGPLTEIGGPGFAGANKIGVSSDGRLFVAEPNNRILVFAPGANGNVPPSQVIKDSTVTGLINQGGIGVRSCNCQ